MTESAKPGTGEVRVFTLDDFCRPAPPVKPRREYAHYLPLSSAYRAVYSVLTVNLSWLDAALAGSHVWCGTKENRVPGPTVNPAKYQNAVSILEAGQPIFMPCLDFQRGRTGIQDGRHRLYALLDAGYTHSPVIMRHEYVPMIATLCESGEEKPA
ncbi:hypothetical protein ACMHYO_22775 [Allopusillimonas ginsengisoli]|uniref:hypothetical protein n=1 Tax=Allopusillimonas ginsengisoli TaxID=453575 RepID=UPI0039C00DE4